MSKIRSFFSSFLPLSLLLGLFVRSYQFADRFSYAHDNDLASWIIKDIVFDHHLRLIGQLTSSPGIFIGPIYYYLLIPFYALAHWDPIGSVWFSVIIGGLAIASVYYVFNRLYGRLPASVGSLIYAVSWSIAGTEREVVPTTPVFLWTIWFYYTINLLFQGKSRGILYAFILAALVWDINLALGLVFPLVLIALLVRHRRFVRRDFLVPAVSALVLSLPLILFEVRHGFSQTRALWQTLVHTGSGHINLPAKLNHVVLYAAQNATRIFYWNPPADLSVYLIPVLLLLFLVYLSLRRRFLQPRDIFIYLFWLSAFIGFFLFNSINLSEYYLNGANILWICLATLVLSWLMSLGRFARVAALVVVAFFAWENLSSFITAPNNASGYVERTALVKYIAADAAAHRYPCIAVSYITSPGNNLGYRYLFYRAGLHVNQPKSQSPVYTIVFPLSYVDRLDKTFGSLGVILPDYNRYTPSGIAVSCSGANANLTDPMFGFTN